MLESNLIVTRSWYPSSKGSCRDVNRKTDCFGIFYFFYRDIIVVGLQEIVKLNAMSIFGGKNTTKIDEWKQLLGSTINSIYASRDPDENFVWVIERSMVGCLIALFVKNKLFKSERLKDIHHTKIKTGLGGSSGNKGAVILRFKLDDTTIALVNCHLMSGKGKGSKRTDEINFIFDNAFKSEPVGKVRTSSLILNK